MVIEYICTTQSIEVVVVVMFAVVVVVVVVVVELDFFADLVLKMTSYWCSVKHLTLHSYHTPFL